MHFEGFTGSSAHAEEDDCGITPTIACAERARQREIYSYLSAASYPSKIPSGHPGIGRGFMNTDDTLNQLVQLGALQLGCDRAILGFIDHENEYAVAEATRFQTPAQRRAKEHPELVVGVAKLPHATDTSGMVPHTIDAFIDAGGDGKHELNGPYVYAKRDRYIITDMRMEATYANKHCVTHFKPGIISFIAVPLVNSLGYVLGSYMIGDSKLNNFGDEEVEILTGISQSIMNHLELVRSKQNIGRSEKLMKGLAEFMERESPVPHERTLSMSTRATSERTQSEAPDSVHGAEGEDEDGKAKETDKNARPQPHTHQSSSTIQTSSSDAVFSPGEGVNTDTPPSTPPDESRDPFDTANGDAIPAEDAPHEEPAPPAPESTISEEVKKTFSRAASTIRQAMNFDGMMFIDAVPSGFGTRSNTATPYEKQEDPFQSDTAESTSNDAEEMIMPKYLAKDVKPEAMKGHTPPPEGYCPIPESLLQKWIRRFPRGHIFTADEYGPIDCRYGPGNSIQKTRRPRRRSSRIFNDTADLFYHFPHVRYVTFLPLWHFQRECWFAAAFGWISFESQQSVDYSDINLLSAFSNSLMAEVSRIEALSVSRAKSDFISSISHELRSPLHGILASGELLREALEDPNLLSMIDMIDSCGTTLLDTFNNLLDYAKINNVAKANDKGEEEGQTRRVRKPEAKSTDLSILIQDTVEAVNLGHMSKTAFHATGHQQHAVFTTLAELAQAEEDFPDNSIVVTMNIEKRSSWMTKIDPGAWKRIVMNIFGNSLKYTRAGHIEVGLKITDMPEQRKKDGLGQAICFSVKDTGIGMSADYLKYQLFTPFAQENNLSPGTGLGLSIVNQIVKGMNGKLDVQSQIGVGTHIKVFVPLNPDTAGPLGQQMPPIDEVSQFDAEGKLQGKTLQIITPEAYKALVYPELEITQEIRDRFRAMRSGLRHIAVDTFGMNVVYDTPDPSKKAADIYFFDAYLIGKAVHGKLSCAMHKKIVQLTPLVILCSGAGPLSQLKNEKLAGKMLHLRHPIGPKKMANVFLSALEVGKLDISACASLKAAVPEAQWENKAEEPKPVPAEVKEAVKEHVNAQNGDHQEPPHRPEATPVQHILIEQKNTTTKSSPAVLTGAAAGGSAKQCQHLLLVDDNPINLKILTTLVKKLSHTYETASNGLEAVQLYKASLIQQNPFDFVFMDISMPVMNGFEATREIRKFEKEEKVNGGCRIAALTGLGSEVSRQEAFASGTNLFLTKPVKMGEIRKLLERESVRGENAVGVKEEKAGAGAGAENAPTVVEAAAG